MTNPRRVEIRRCHFVTTEPTAMNGPSSPDPAENQTEGVGDDTTFAPGSFTGRGEDAESAAFINDDTFSGGEFAAGPEST